MRPLLNARLLTRAMHDDAIGIATYKADSAPAPSSSTKPKFAISVKNMIHSSLECPLSSFPFLSNPSSVHHVLMGVSIEELPKKGSSTVDILLLGAANCKACQGMSHSNLCRYEAEGREIRLLVTNSVLSFEELKANLNDEVLRQEAAARREQEVRIVHGAWSKRSLSLTWTQIGSINRVFSSFSNMLSSPLCSVEDLLQTTVAKRSLSILPGLIEEIIDYL
ncbi:hypothetical protein EV421DRAFT_1970193 [Armillaria borealis]|uniref:Uncharacterized protein n=1 Tax=Armillaria borealis TaxID=47425 RepID=A0AA39MLL4_9AGAR|nr:hypothetical protein EV421DRAFT_1970193 [Armillaria borealis]